MQLLWRLAKQTFIVSVITLMCGFGGILFYLMSENRTQISSAERLVAYVLAWPLIQIEHLGGVEDFMGDATPEHHAALWSAWITLWIYYFVLLAFWHRRRSFSVGEAR